MRNYEEFAKIYITAKHSQGNKAIIMLAINRMECRMEIEVDPDIRERMLIKIEKIKAQM